MNFNDLQEGLRTAGYFNLEEILYAIIQTNGTITVLPKAKYAPLTADAVDVIIDEASLPIIVVAEGKIIKENTELAKISNDFILNNIKSCGIKSIKDILLMTINSNGKIYVQSYSGTATSVNAVGYKGDW